MIREFLIKYKLIILVTIFAIAMGFFETAVVVYLRELFYPEGFKFPLKSMNEFVLKVEILREFATIIMLICIGAIAGKNFHQRFAYFIYSFATWDIFYYIFLKASLGWPGSFLTWDILFLIPVVWIGPVLAPVICSVSMIALALVILKSQETDPGIRLRRSHWALLISGSLIILFTFIYDYSALIIKGGSLPDLLTLAHNREFQKIIEDYSPQEFNWLLFILGEVMVLTGIFLFALKKGSRFFSGVK